MNAEAISSVRLRSKPVVFPFQAGFLRALFVCLSMIFPQGCLQDEYEIIISHHDPDKAYEGNTFFQAHVFHPGYFSIRMDGEVLWQRASENILQGNGVGLEVMRDGDVVTMLDRSHPTIIDPDTDEALRKDTEHRGHHMVAETP
jgi:hypothetical protein